MEFFIVLFQTAVKMIILAVAAVGGIYFGKILRDKKDVEIAAEKAANDTKENM